MTPLRPSPVDCVQAALNRGCVAGRSRTLRAAPEVIFPAPDDRPGRRGGARPARSEASAGARGPRGPRGTATDFRVFLRLLLQSAGRPQGGRLLDADRLRGGASNRLGVGVHGRPKPPRRAYGAGSSPLALWPSKDRPPGPAHRPRTACSSP